MIMNEVDMFIENIELAIADLRAHNNETFQIINQDGFIVWTGDRFDMANAFIELSCRYENEYFRVRSAYQ